MSDGCTWFIRSQVNYKETTVEYIIHIEDRDFLAYIVTKGKPKGWFKALKVEVHRGLSNLKVTMPFGTNENAFKARAKSYMTLMYKAYESYKASKGMRNIFGDVFDSFSHE